MSVKLLLTLGTRHPVVGNVDPAKHIAGSVHDFGSKVESELVMLGHATMVKRAEPKRTEEKPTRKRKTKPDEPKTEEV